MKPFQCIPTHYKLSNCDTKSVATDVRVYTKQTNYLSSNGYMIG